MGIHPVHAALATDYVKQLIQIRARQIAHKPGFRRSDQEDLEQELAVHILKQAHHFDPSRGCVNTFIDRIVDSAVAMILRDRRRLKRATGFRSRSLDEAILHGKRERGSLAELLDESDGHRRIGGQTLSGQQQVELTSDIPCVVFRLQPHLQEIARRLVNTTEVAIARDMGISRRQVRNTVEAIRRHFEKAGFTGI